MEPTTILLEPAGFSFSSKPPWPLELTESDVTLKNSDGQVVFVMPRSAAISRLMVYDGNSKVTLVDDQGTHLKFKGDRGKGAAALCAYQDFALARDPAAVRALRRQGVGLLTTGAVLAVVCWGFIVTMLFAEPFRSMKEIPPTLGGLFRFSWMPALASLFMIFWGVATYRKSRRYAHMHAQRQADPSGTS